MLYKASEAIALLDMLTSLAACNISSDYGRYIKTIFSQLLTFTVLG